MQYTLNASNTVIPQKYADAQALILLGTELVGLKGLTSKT